MEPADRPPLRSFRPRRRRLGPTAQAVWDAGADHVLVPETGPLLDFGVLFGRTAPVVLDIGFGGGEALVERATAEPEHDVIGVEVHLPGLAGVVREVAERSLGNVRLVDGDATVFLGRVPSASLAEVRVYFPDPWPKVRHQKRRIIRPDVLGRLTDRLRPGGVLRLATDWPDYAESMAAVCAAEPRLTGGPVARPDDRPVTRFERRGLAEGLTIHDLRYTRVG